MEGILSHILDTLGWALRSWQESVTGTAPARCAGTLVPVVPLWLAWGDALAQTSSKPRCTRCGGEGFCCTEYPERDVEHGGTWLLDTSGRMRITGVCLINVGRTAGYIACRSAVGRRTQPRSRHCGKLS